MSDPLTIEQGSIIRRMRKVQRMTIGELAERAELSISFISQLERGLTNPSISSLRRIALVLNLPLSSFFEEIHRDNGPMLEKPNAVSLRIATHG